MFSKKNTYEFFEKHVRVSEKTRTCFFRVVISYKSNNLRIVIIILPRILPFPVSLLITGTFPENSL